MDGPWMILVVQNREEFNLATYVSQEMDGEAYAAKSHQRCWVRRVRRFEVVERPLFVGYVFARGFYYGGLRTAPGHPRVAAIGGRALTLRDAEVAQLRAREAAGEFDSTVAGAERLTVGDVVEVGQSHKWLAGEDVRILALPRFGKGNAKVELVAHPGQRLSVDVAYLAEMG